MENVNLVTLVNTTQNKVQRICRTESTAILHGKILEVQGMMNDVEEHIMLS